MTGPTGMTATGPVLLTADQWTDYALLDSGDGRKLERYGPRTVIRPEPQAIWRPVLEPAAWQAADAAFTGSADAGQRWHLAEGVSRTWTMRYGPAAFEAAFTSFRHLGVFPEQAVHWDWIRDRIARAGRPIHVLNLFAYTGIASLIAASAGARVTHVDASKKAITWANRNQALAGLEDAPIRWICDDAVKFLRRENRRENRYDGILADPPKYGRGAKGEVWDLFGDLPELLHLCRGVLSDSPLFAVATLYAIRLSSQSLHNGLGEALTGLGGHLESGEMGVTDSGGRVLASAAFSRWQAGR